MTDEPDDDSFLEQNEKPAKESGAEQVAGGAERTSNGRFAAGHCPNPKGRPRKQTPALQDVLFRILNETVPGSAKNMSVMEGLMRSLCAKAFKEPSTALSIIKFATSNPRTKSSDEHQVADHEERSEALERHVEREHRRRTLRDNTSRGPGDDPEEGS